MKPYLTTAFRNPLLWILPALFLPLLVAVGAIMLGRQDSVQASVWTQTSSLLDTTATTNLAPPAQVEADVFNQWLNTEAFRSSIITAAGLDDKVNSGEWPKRSSLGSLLAKFPLTKSLVGGPSTDPAVNHDRALAALKTRLSAQVHGNNLLFITYKGGGSADEVALVKAAMDTYQKQNLGVQSTQAQALIDFYTNQVNSDQQALAQSDTDLQAFETTHPASLTSPRPPLEAQQLAQLQSTYNIHLSQYELALSRLSDAQARAQASVSSSNTDFQVVDQPSAKGPALQLKLTGLLIFAGIVFGFGVAGLLIALRTWSDDTVREPEDVRKLFGRDALATMPSFKKGGN
ncbi:MAG: hypothetical protein ABSG55_00675 [Dehalococcoidia bacterium]|jgi:uncharacterized protein involved in exopolysaccharide biosynthesis